MFTPFLLSFFCVVVAGTAAALFIPNRTITEHGPDQDEAGG